MVGTQLLGVRAVILACFALRILLLYAVGAADGFTRRAIRQGASGCVVQEGDRNPLKSGLLDSFVRPQTLHSRQLRIRWIVLSAVASLLLAGTLAARASLEFERTAGKTRPELGMSTSTRGPGYIGCPSPRQLVWIEVKVSGPDSTIEYETLPVSTYGDHQIGVTFWFDDGLRVAGCRPPAHSHRG